MSGGYWVMRLKEIRLEKPLKIKFNAKIFVLFHTVHYNV